ncbi:hypothetical protein CBL_06994 [Carabus blaptoides fortunei]
MSRSFLVDSLINNSPKDYTNKQYQRPTVPSEHITQANGPLFPYPAGYISSYLFSLGLAQQQQNHMNSTLLHPIYGPKAPVRPVVSMPVARQLQAPQQHVQKTFQPKTSPLSREPSPAYVSPHGSPQRLSPSVDFSRTPSPPPSQEERRSPGSGSKDMSSKRIRTAFTRLQSAGKCCCLRTCSSSKKSKASTSSCDETDIDIMNTDDEQSRSVYHT